MCPTTLEYENQQILALLQAMWGAISENMLGVSLKCDGEAVHLYFALERESKEDREEIEDIVAELEALQSKAAPIQSHVFVLAEPWQGIGSLVGRPVYVRKVVQR
jgi:ElaB/YqjD/DUF883 family membrane-anchored ribosome-binding protein